PAPPDGKAARLTQPPPPSPLLQHLVTQHAKGEIPVWTGGEMVVRVADIVSETRDVKTYRMVGLTPTLFSYMPGQFITLNLEIDGKSVKRSYSLSSTPSRPHTIEITVKRVEGGLVSNWLADNVKLGDTLKITGPAGKFSCFEFPSQKMLFIAAGSGVTPVMSMSRWIADTAADVDVVYFICNRSCQDIIFRKELDILATRNRSFRGMMTITSGLTGNESWMGFTGRPTRQMLEMTCPDFMERHVFLCGPGPYMDAVKELLRDMDFPMANLHTESFGKAGKPKRVATGTVPPPEAASPASMIVDAAVVQKALSGPAPAPVEAAAPVVGFEVVFASSGKVVLADAKDGILDIAEMNGVDIDYACRTGSCGTCKVHCKSGTVEMEDDSGLTPEEKKEGWILTCVGYPRSRVELDA
ncbi:MAG TPA: hybrid-cluster NAD(P)-dependent oxidoreductase, partial [Candidatus Saccharimonadales bacterium]|nr:hybrid-cluster NAD(P)-dependent oxidoreductase [Candidatus Saccharimonadales bacterium]